MKSKYCIPSTMLPFCLAFLFSIFMVQSSFAQQTLSISGKIISSDDGMGIPGVSVAVEGTTKGTTTDIEGNYQLAAVAANAVLKFSYVGFKTMTIAVNNQTVINGSLQTEAAELNEIVVVGYGTQKRKVSTAATSVVSGRNLEQTASIDATSALQGQSSGVSITSTSGQPGAGMVVNIRGTGTVGNSTPLYVVDGVVVDGGIGYLDPSSIDRIDILKDASAASIYGARAANGVVLVTTKKGKDGKMNISLNSYLGFQSVYKKLDLLNSTEYAMIMNEARVNSGYAPLYTQDQIKALPNQDWQKELFNDGAVKQNHSLLITGGDKKSTYATGLSYYGQEGLIGSNTGQSKYDRVTFNINTTSELIEKYLRFGENFAFSNTKSKGVSDDGVYSNSVRGFLNAPPTYNAYNADGTFGSSDISADITNPLGSLYYNNFNETESNRYVGNVFLEANFLSDFTFKTSFGVDISDSNFRSFLPVYQLSSVGYNTISSVTQSNTRNRSWIWENTLQYKKTFAGVHNIDVLVGTSARERMIESFSATGKDLIFNDFGHAYLSNATDKTLNTVSGGPVPYNIQSYFGRILYDYNNKYLFTATIRRDGSSEFGANYKYAYFPAFSAGWNIDRENFFPKEAIVKSLKLRASWGQNGNDQFNQRFAYLSTISSYDQNYHFGTGNNENPLEVGGSPTKLENPNLKWETSEQTDLGVDATLFNNLNVSVDFYNKTTKDWIVQPDIPLYGGVAAPFVNGGDVENKGVEFSASYRTKFGSDWNFSVNGNISYNKNEVTRIANQSGIIYGDTNLLFQGLDEMNRVQVGQPIGYFYGLKTNGIFQNQAEINAYSSNGALIQPNAQPGDVRFVDLNGDGQINQDDKTKVGDPNPDYTYGISMELSYKAFDFSVYTYGVAGNQNVNGIRSNERPFYNYTTDILNRWTGEGTSNSVPRVTYGADSNGNYTKFSDMYVEDAGFFRIKTVTFGCDLTKLTTKLSRFSKIRLYVSANNLFTFTKYSGLDPEIGFGNVNQSWAKGIDVGYYPQPRTYMVGLNVNF